MERKVAGLIGVVSGLATIGAAQAAPNPAPAPLQVASYADLLAPIPNAAEMLKADDAARARDALQSVRIAQGYYPYGYSPYYYGYNPYYYHHHHHHYRYYRYHHHHHHHHNGYYRP